MADIKVTQVRSTIGAKPKARGTMRALGLRGIGQSNVLPDRPEIQGMIRRVTHLVAVEAAEPAKPAKKAAAKPAEKAEPETENEDT